ncbi:hypothetical protein HYW74_04965 [Candidatus Pacearchaeota archaeon]|nr:hypothetical protein [Candidatus Pacearchaeota archaeon]
MHLKGDVIRRTLAFKRRCHKKNLGSFYKGKFNKENLGCLYMFTQKELGHLLVVLIILGFSVSLGSIISNGLDYSVILINFLLILIILLVSILAKKAAAYYYEAKIEHSIWMWERFGFKREERFPKPLPLGIIAPVIFSISSYGKAFWLAALEFDVYSTSARVSKRHGEHRYTEMTEIHIGLIAAAGVVATLIASVIGYLAGFPEFSKLSIYYAFYSMIPFGNLDGTKIFFGSRLTWYTLGIICLIFLGYAFAFSQGIM